MLLDEEDALLDDEDALLDDEDALLDEDVLLDEEDALLDDEDLLLDEGALLDEEDALLEELLDEDELLDELLDEDELLDKLLDEDALLDELLDELSLQLGDELQVYAEVNHSMSIAVCNFKLRERLKVDIPKSTRHFDIILTLELNFIPCSDLRMGENAPLSWPTASRSSISVILKVSSCPRWRSW